MAEGESPAERDIVRQRGQQTRNMEDLVAIAINVEAAGHETFRASLGAVKKPRLSVMPHAENRAAALDLLQDRTSDL